MNFDANATTVAAGPRMSNANEVTTTGKFVAYWFFAGLPIAVSVRCDSPRMA